MPLDATTLARFWSKVDCSGGPDACWLWRGTTVNGYGVIKTHGKQLRCHRVAWELAHGPIPNGLCVCHTCDVRNCVNVAHHWLGTTGDNMADRTAKGRAARGSRNGTHMHPERLARGERNGARLYPERLVRGEENRNAKLTAEVVAEIYRRAHAGETRATIAHDYGISMSNVTTIKQRKTWRHVTGRY
jgi:hypothetical protein